MAAPTWRGSGPRRSAPPGLHRQRDSQASHGDPSFERGRLPHRHRGQGQHFIASAHQQPAHIQAQPAGTFGPNPSHSQPSLHSGSSGSRYSDRPQPQMHHQSLTNQRVPPAAMAQSQSPMRNATQTFFNQAQQGHYGNAISPSQRGRGRGSRGRSGDGFASPRRGFSNASGGYSGTPSYDPNSRPPSLHNQLYDPRSAPRAVFGDQQSHPEAKIVIQNDFLGHVAARELLKQISQKELQDKETFRRKLERTAQLVVAKFAKDHVTVKPADVKLKCYGSLASGFAVPGSDMDLLVVFPMDQESVKEVKEAFPRLMEQALLSQGIGANLLEKTRVPILRVCQNPTQKLLDTLTKARLDRNNDEQEFQITKAEAKAQLNTLPIDPTVEQLSAATTALADLDIDPADIALPDSPTRADTDFGKEVGIQCDINFSNYVALHNTALLRCYCKCDPRVREMGLVVKAWTKARKINSPRYGTLSSYGYIMMVLHFLMNIAQPPVIPNLQLMYRPPPPHLVQKEVTTVDGFDVRFFRDEAAIDQAAANRQITPSRESLGSLLRGFFNYYANNRGFRWMQEVISIRTNGGILLKAQKGWTAAKHDEAHSHHYVLAIEDPFETEHNIARTVRHRGVVAIRDEFRRAHMILNRVQYIDGVGWEWLNDQGEVGEELMAEAEDRGDLVRPLPGTKPPMKDKAVEEPKVASSTDAVQKLKKSLGIGVDSQANRAEDVASATAVTQVRDQNTFTDRTNDRAMRGRDQANRGKGERFPKSQDCDKKKGVGAELFEQQNLKAMTRSLSQALQEGVNQQNNERGRQVKSSKLSVNKQQGMRQEQGRGKKKQVARQESQSPRGRPAKRNEEEANLIGIDGGSSVNTSGETLKLDQPAKKHNTKALARVPPVGSVSAVTNSTKLDNPGPSQRDRKVQRRAWRNRRERKREKQDSRKPTSEIRTTGATTATKETSPDTEQPGLYALHLSSSRVNTESTTLTVPESESTRPTLEKEAAETAAFRSVLDQRQLLDLARISSGGNGCVRSGDEMKVIMRKDETGRVVGYGDAVKRGPTRSHEILGWMGSVNGIPSTTEDGGMELVAEASNEKLMEELPFGCDLDDHFQQ